MIKTVSAALVLLLTVVLPPVYAGVMLDRVVAVVNEEAITLSELYRAMQQELGRNLQSASKEKKMEMLRNNEYSFLEKMIDKSLLLQEARKKGLTVSKKEVDRAIQSIKQEHSVSEEELTEALREEGLTYANYKKRVFEQILTTRLMQQEVLEKITVSNDDIHLYLRENGLKNGTQYRIRQIFVEKAQNKSSVKKIDELQRRLASGEDFGRLARAYSEGPAGSKGGDLGYVNLGQLSKEFREALKGMSIGDVTLIRSESGLHLIKLEEIRDVREAVKEALYIDRYGKWLKALRERAYIEIRL
jgi:peptidyl-prolyl cis-trans isomerase SurA